MAHARPEDLLDIADVLDEVRVLPGVAEGSPGVFYIGHDPFLHFHTKAGARWADARAGREWGRPTSVAHEHIYWDQASVLVQIGLLDASRLPVAGVEMARKVIDPSRPSNELMRRR
jgi:hypothetical protein